MAQLFAPVERRARFRVAFVRAFGDTILGVRLRLGMGRKHGGKWKVRWWVGSGGI